MMINDIPFNMTYTIGNDLREKPKDRASFEQGISYLTTHLTKEKTTIGQLKVHSLLGVLYRIVEQLEASMIHLQIAKAGLQTIIEGDKLQIVNSIRIAQTLQYQQKYEQAEQIYNTLEPLILQEKAYKKLLDFVYQHKAKNYFEWGKYEQSLSEIKRAIALRQLKGNEELLASSTFALKKIQEARR